MVILTAAGVVVAGVALGFQSTQTRRAAAEQARFSGSEIQRRYDSLRESRATYESQFASAFIPYIIAGSEKERRYAFGALAQGAPRVVKELADVALERSAGDDERVYIEQIRDEASRRELEEEFRSQLAQARELAQLELVAEACGAFLRAWNGLPTSLGSLTDTRHAEGGLAGCTSHEGGNRLQGLTSFRSAFAKIQSQ